MNYRVKEIFLTLQGEGIHTGKAAVFCRFSGCNLWSGHEKDREDAICRFCDTDFVGTDGPGGGIFKNGQDLAGRLAGEWRNPNHPVFAVFTGGEPLLQMDDELISSLKDKNIRIAIETNGTILAPEGINWICVSPKAGTDLQIKRGDELKLVFPQDGIDPEQYLGYDFKHFLLQPLDGPDLELNTRLAVKYIKDNPIWRLSLQTHKYIKIP